MSYHLSTWWIIKQRAVALDFVNIKLTKFLSLYYTPDPMRKLMNQNKIRKVVDSGPHSLGLEERNSVKGDQQSPRLWGVNY